MTYEKVKLLFLIPSLRGGGAERTLINLLERLSTTSKYDITLVVVSYNGVYINQIPNEVKVIPLFKSDLFVRVLSFLQKKIAFNYIFKMVIRLKVKEYYNISICFLDGNMTDLLFFIQNTSKRISWVHCSYKSNENYYRYFKNESYRQKILSERYNRLDEIVFVSEDSKNEFISIFGKKNRMRVIFNYLNESSVLEKMGSNEINEKKDSLIFIALGSLHFVKGYDLLIEAAEILKKEGFNFIIEIYGDGYLMQNLENQITIKSLSEIVLLKGFTSNPYKHLRKADIFIMTSRSEALPVALCEAMLIGKPTLVTNCSGCREVVGNGEYGLMVEQSAFSIADGMRQYLTNPHLLSKFAEASLERSKLFSDDKIFNQVINLIESK